MQDKAGNQFFAVFPSVMLPMFLAVVDQTIVASALPAIASSLGGVERVSWVVVAYLLATTVAAPVYGQLRDKIGGRRMMFVALAIFMASSLLCAVSRSIEMLAFARILQGLGGGGLMTLSQALVGEAVPPLERAKYQGYLAAVAVTSSVFGPVAGGFLTEHIGWRSVFLVNLPIALVALWLTARTEPRPVSGEPWVFDTRGLLWFTGFIVPVLLAVEQAQRMTAGAGVWFILLLGVGGYCLKQLLEQEASAPHPLLQFDLLRRPAIWRSNAMAACHGAALVSLITYLPLYFHVSRGASAAGTGLLLLPMMIGIGVGSMLTGRAVSRTGLTMIFPSVGMIVAVFSLLLLSIWVGQLGTWQLNVLLLMIGLSMGTVMAVVQVTVQRAAGNSQLGAAAASIQFSRSVGAAVGTALVGAVLFATLALADAEVAGMFGRIVQADTSVLSSLPPTRQFMVQTAIVHAFGMAFFMIAVFAAGGLALAWSHPERHL